ncbi:Jag N-terminal domain-containing protein [Streptococcus uberis]|nr:Jag N-terminal domain-containing protein [Streptococcus uberis]
MPTFSGKTVNDAIENGLNQLGIDRNHADIKTIQEPRKGVLGAFARDAEVEIIELTDSDLKKKSTKKRKLKWLQYSEEEYYFLY